MPPCSTGRPISSLRRAQQALDSNDLGAYQQAVERLGQLIQQAKQLTGAPPSPTTAKATSPP
jgi:hypothetical protein